MRLVLLVALEQRWKRHSSERAAVWVWKEVWKRRSLLVAVVAPCVVEVLRQLSTTAP